MSEEMREIAESVQRDLQDKATNDESAFLSKLVLVSEWLSPSGEKWINLHRCNGSGEDIPRWDSAGLLHYALYDLNPRVEEEDIEE